MTHGAKGTVLIVGATSDMAMAIAHRFAADGYDLVLTARDVGRIGDDVADLGHRYGRGVQGRGFDILDQDAHAPLLAGLIPPPDIVVLAVGLLGDQTQSSADPGAASLVMRTNYLAPALFLERAAAAMAHRGAGTIVAISSVAGERGRGSNYTYGSAKAGLTAFLSGLRNRLTPLGIRVITVKPGFVATRMTAGMRLPPLLTAQPVEVADAVAAAVRRRRSIVYVRPIWWLIMVIVRFLPESLFRRLRL